MSGLGSILFAALPLVVTPHAVPTPAPTTTVGTSPASADLEDILLREAPALHSEALHAALASYAELSTKGEVQSPYLTVIDYGLSSRSKRMWVFDLTTKHLVFHELVAHGRNSGEDMARSFSNEDGSHMTSLGAFVTEDTYEGKNGYSLRLRGMDPGRNDHAEARAIVMHGAPYVSEQIASTMGRLGRSWGCPAIRLDVAKQLIDDIRGRSLVYAWHPSMLAPAVAVAGSRSGS
jgi:hypothetical protein